MDVNELRSGETGCWVVCTVGSIHYVDLDRWLYMRVPGEGRSAMEGDREWLRLLRIERWPRVGGSFLLFVDPPDEELARTTELWRISSEVMSIERQPL
ncbi:hypothetical protein [Nocardioides sambongensis]|uniref:hypothetical protein n=1 Tax=Nocardioides sambongensis TaxID=2589074 RepID=UPI00112C3461|nr:hypothetical protein [Nocardioides sambongensis]